MLSDRQIHKSSRSQELNELLEMIFAQELLVPSKELWIVSPWISNIPILDNSTYKYACIDPNWGRTEIRLSEILMKLMLSGTFIYLVIKDPVEEKSNYWFREEFENQTKLYGFLDKSNFKIIYKTNLHAKGILTDSSVLSGSMNLTYYGVTRNNEQIDFRTNPQSISKQLLIYKQEYLNAG